VLCYAVLWLCCAVFFILCCAVLVALRCAVLVALRCAMLVALCCAVLCCAVLCCAVLCCAVLGWAGLGWAGLGWAGSMLCVGTQASVAALALRCSVLCLQRCPSNNGRHQSVLCNLSSAPLLCQSSCLPQHAP